MLLLGIFEFGYRLRNSAILANSLRRRPAPRRQAQLDPDSDLFALQTFAASTANLKNVTINRVIIYNAGTADGQPAGRLPHGVSGPPPYTVSAEPAVQRLRRERHRGGGHGQLHLHGDDRAASTWDKNWDACHREQQPGRFASTTSGCTPT